MLSPASSLPSQSPYRNRIWTKSWWRLLSLRGNGVADWWYLRHISVKSNMCNNFATCQHLLVFSNQIVRHDNSSVHVQGQTHHVKVLESKSGCKTAKKFNFCLQVSVKWERNSEISDEIYNQNLREWGNTSYRSRGPCPVWICLNDDRDAAFIHASNCITLCTDLVHLVEINEIAYGMSWKFRWTSWVRKGKEVELYLPKTSEMIYLASRAGRKRRNAMGPCHFSLR